MDSEPDVTSARRVVVGPDANGASTVTVDAPVEPMAFGGPGGPHLAVLWELVADGPRWSSTDPGAYTPLPEPGTVRLVQLVLPATTDPDALAIPMHSTPTVDLLYVAQGQAEVVLDDGPTLLRAGDYLVMHSPVHGWRNTGDVDCVLVAAMAGSAPPD